MLTLAHAINDRTVIMSVCSLMASDCVWDSLHCMGRRDRVNCEAAEQTVKKKKIAKSLKERGRARAACAARITCKIHLVDPEGAKVENE